MPKALEPWALADDGVCEVHSYAKVKLCFEFREDTLQTFLFNSRQFQIPFLDRRALNASVEFLDIVRVTHHVGSCVGYTPNIFVHSWGFNPTDTIPSNVSSVTLRAYDPVCSFHGLVFRSNHEHLRLK